MDFYTELNRAKKERKLNNEDLGRMLGKTGEAVRKALSRKSLSDLEKSVLSNEFRLGHLTVPKEGSGLLINRIVSKGVPYYDIDFTLGFEGIENSQQIQPDSYITHPFFTGCDYVIRASGQSMAKIIKHGDAIGLIEISNWQEFIPLGEVYAIVTNNGFRMIKVITKGDDDDSFTLLSKPSFNKKEEFPPQQIKKSNVLKIFKVQASSHLF